MKYIKGRGGIAAIALVVVIIGVALAAITPSGTSTGIHRLTLSSSQATDSGLGFFKLANAGSDSIVSDGFYLMRASVVDTQLAMPRIEGRVDSFGGIAKAFIGNVASATGTFFAQTSDTAGRVQANITYSSENMGSGTWSSTFTGFSSQTGTSNFLAASSLSTKILRFGDSSAAVSGASDREADLGDALAIAGDSLFLIGGPAASGSVDTVVAVSIDTFETFGGNVNDTMRIIVVTPAGIVSVDSQMIRKASAATPTSGPIRSDTVFFSPAAIHFETGTTKINIVYWDASQQKYGFKFGSVTVGATKVAVGVGTTITSTYAVAAATIAQVRSVTITNANAIVTSIVITDLTGDAGSFARNSDSVVGTSSNDAFTNTDSNTVGFAFRLPNGVFKIDLFDASGNKVFKVSSPQTVVVSYNFAQLSAAQAAKVKLLHLNATTNQWENVVSSVPDSAAGTITSTATDFSSIFALGALSGGSQLVGNSSRGCVINNALGHTSLAGVMPSLRGVRDTVLSSSIGRLLVTGYYGFAGAIALLIVAGFGLTSVAGKRR